MKNILPQNFYSQNVAFCFGVHLFVHMFNWESCIVIGSSSKFQKKNYPPLIEHFSKYFLNTSYVQGAILNVSGNKYMS